MSLREHRDVVRGERARFRGAILALQWVFVAPLVGTIGLSWWYLEGDVGDGLLNAVHAALLFTCGAAGVFCLRPGALALSLPLRCSPTAYAWAVAAAAGMLGIGWAWVALLTSLSEVPDIDVEIPTAMLIAVLVMAPLLEEWLCRGVLWEACQRITGVGGTIAITSILFGFLHGLNGGYLLEVPHRAIGGVLIGVLRWKGGSLGPCVLAHFLNNLAAVSI